jgi:hypothetical protein
LPFSSFTVPFTVQTSVPQAAGAITATATSASNMDVNLFISALRLISPGIIATKTALARRKSGVP